jgi:hypothetical protein
LKRAGAAAPSPRGWKAGCQVSLLARSGLDLRLEPTSSAQRLPRIGLQHRSQAQPSRTYRLGIQRLQISSREVCGGSWRAGGFSIACTRPMIVNRRRRAGWRAGHGVAFLAAGIWSIGSCSSWLRAHRKVVVHVLEEKIGNSPASAARNQVGGHHGRECARGGAAGARAYPVGRCGEKRLTRGPGEVAVGMLIATRVPVHV